MTLRNGQDYVASLRDDREVYIGGERIDDVTSHPATRGLIETHAELFDLQFDPEHRDVLTYESDKTGEREAIFYQFPRTTSDLERRRRASELWADYTCGMVARTNDFLASSITGMAIGHEYFSTADRDYGQHVLEYYRYCRDEQVTLSHALSDPQIDRSSDASAKHVADGADRPGALRRVDETDDGIIVSGARMLASLGPQVEEIFIYPTRGRYAEGEEHLALAFAVPVAADGLRMVCRPSVAADDVRNQPLSTRFEDQDTFVVLDRVFVPWERVFVNGDIEIANGWRGEGTAFANLGYHQIGTTHLAKAEFAFGVAMALAESTGIDEYFHVQEKLGEIAHVIETIRSCLIASEATASTFKDSDVLVPSKRNLFAVSDGLFPDAYPRIRQIIRDLAGSGAIAVPAFEDLEAEGVLGGDVETYFRGKEVGARERLSIQKLAFELVVSGMGGREELYERFSSGGPMRGKIKMYNKYPDKASLKETAIEYAFQGANRDPDADESP